MSSFISKIMSTCESVIKLSAEPGEVERYGMATSECQYVSIDGSIRLEARFLAVARSENSSGISVYTIEILGRSSSENRVVLADKMRFRDLRARAIRCGLWHKFPRIVPTAISWGITNRTKDILTWAKYLPGSTWLNANVRHTQAINNSVGRRFQDCLLYLASIPPELSQECMAKKQICDRRKAVIERQSQLAEQQGREAHARSYPEKCDYCFKRFLTFLERAHHETMTHKEWTVNNTTVNNKTVNNNTYQNSCYHTHYHSY